MVQSFVRSAAAVNRPRVSSSVAKPAVLLRHECRKTKDQRFLETLLAYNVADTVNLEALMAHGSNLHVRHRPFRKWTMLVLSARDLSP
jgi:hypothetical protein